MSGIDPASMGLDDPLIVAHLDLVRRGGARSVQVRYSDDEQPVVWMAVATFNGAHTDGEDRHEVSAGMTPMLAVQRLADELVDGSKCVHCKRPAGVWRDWADAPPMGASFCWYVYDPETKRFRRSCEGEATAGRNDPCPCGSGRKFKRCHGAP